MSDTQAISAREAKRIATDNDVNVVAGKIYQRIKSAAVQGHMSTGISDFGFSDTAYLQDESSWPIVGKVIRKELLAMGYAAQFESLSPSTGMAFLRVSWAEAPE